jgi:hypothetical protein
VAAAAGQGGRCAHFPVNANPHSIVNIGNAATTWRTGLVNTHHVSALGIDERELIGRFRYITSRAERGRFDRNSVWAFNLAPAFPRGALTLCPHLCMGISPRRYTENGLLIGNSPLHGVPSARVSVYSAHFSRRFAPSGSHVARSLSPLHRRRCHRSLFVSFQHCRLSRLSASP